MSAHHVMHATHNFLEKTKIGHRITSGAVGAAVGVVHVVGGTTAAGIATVLAPVAVPLVLAGGAAYLAAKFFGSKH